MGIIVPIRIAIVSKIKKLQVENDHILWQQAAPKGGLLP